MPETPCCPYCGQTPTSPTATSCPECSGLFEPLSRQATQLAMGPWFVRDVDRPFMPGFNEAILRHQVAAGQIKHDTIVRGPTTNQFWVPAGRAPGVSRLLGKCHACAGQVATDSTRCDACHADLSLPKEVDRLGLSYVTPADRQHAQAEVEALRAGKPAPPPPTGPANVSVQPQQVPDEVLKPLTPIEPEAGDESVSEPGLTDDGADVHDDLWEASAATPSRRVKRRSGPDPVVVVLGVLLLCVVAVGLIVVVTGGLGGEESDDTASADTTPDKPAEVERTADQVASLAEPVIAEMERLRSEGVPDALTERFEAIARLIEQAQREVQREQYNAAYESYQAADDLIEPLSPAIDALRLAEAQQQEIARLSRSVQALREQALSANAEQWSPTAWASGETAIGASRAMTEAEQHARAIDALKQAEDAFRQAFDAAESAGRAVTARSTLHAAMQAGYPEQALRSADAGLVDRLIAKQAEAERHMSSRDYASAERAFLAAADALSQAERAVELARYRKAYAFDAGYRAAGLLIAVATGDGIDTARHEALAQAFDRLALPDNPASALRPSGEADYPAAAEQLVNKTREAITATHGDAAQACYDAGFQAAIIEQTLTTLAMTADQQKRIHQSLAAMQDRAASAGWDLIRARPVFELVRAANRTADVGDPPEQTREAWAVLITPLLEPDKAIRIMDPVVDPGSENDPELFPGLGSSAP